MENSITSQLKTGTLNLLCGGPSAGKTTLIYQAICAHERKEPFFVESLSFPAGPVLVVSTDRNRTINSAMFTAFGIQQTEFISVVDDLKLHTLSKPLKDEAYGMEQFRAEITNRILKLPFHPSTIILDLYGDFISSKSSNLKALAYDGRTNVRWAEQLKTAILGITYPYKQKATNYALRIQDRMAGGLSLQASANWKFNISDRAETKTCWIIDAVPPPMGGPPKTYYAMRQDDSSGIGLFVPCEPPYDADDTATITERYGVSDRQARNILKRMRDE